MVISPSPAVIRRSPEEWDALKSVNSSPVSWVRQQMTNWGLWLSSVAGVRFVPSEPEAWHDIFPIVVEKLSGTPLQVIKKPKLRVQKIANCQAALRKLREMGVKVVAIGPEDLCDARPMMCLALCWSIVLHCEVQYHILEEGVTPKMGLLLRLQEIVMAQNFSSDWLSGAPFAKLMKKTLFSHYATVQTIPIFAQLFPLWLKIQDSAPFTLPRQVWGMIYDFALTPESIYTLYVSAACQEYGIPPFMYDPLSLDDLTLITYVAIVIRTNDVRVAGL